MVLPVTNADARDPTAALIGNEVYISTLNLWGYNDTIQDLEYSHAEL